MVGDILRMRLPSMAWFPRDSLGEQRVYSTSDSVHGVSFRGTKSYKQMIHAGWNVDLSMTPRQRHIYHSSKQAILSFVNESFLFLHSKRPSSGSNKNSTMVVEDGVSIHFVAADTKRPFQEHVKHRPSRGRSSNHDSSRKKEYYVEAEPGAEYYLQIRLLPDCPYGDDNTGDVYVEAEVDGVDLGYHTIMNANDESADYFGILERHGRTSQTTALQFTSPYTMVPHHGPRGTQRPLKGVSTARTVLPRPRTTSSATSHPSMAMMGTVSVTFSEPIYLGREYIADDFATAEELNPAAYVVASSDVASTTGPSPADDGGGTKKAKKAVCSGKGSFAQPEAAAVVQEAYQPGRTYKTVTIHYCTTMGLIYAGVLPAPPDFWKNASPAPPNRAGWSRKFLVPPVPSQKLRAPAAVYNGTVIQEAKEIELFDLSKVSDERRETVEVIDIMDDDDDDDDEEEEEDEDPLDRNHKADRMMNLMQESADEEHDHLMLPESESELEDSDDEEWVET